MTSPTLLVIWFLVAGQAGTQTAPECIPSGADLATAQLCLGAEAAGRGEAMPKGDERHRQFETAAEHFRRASEVASADVKVSAFTALARMYDTEHLDNPAAREGALHELIGLEPTTSRHSFDLAALQESRGFVEAAEATLLVARHAHQEDVETFRQLAQFYARRATALHTSNRDKTPSEPAHPGEPDDNGIYRVGGQLSSPARAGVPLYPEDAKAAGIGGAVQLEIVIDREGLVANAQVVDSIPLLDEAALSAVREWRFEPTIVSGRPVPVRMVVTVTFRP